MKKLILAVTIGSLFFTGCVDAPTQNSGKLKVVTTFYPLYEIAHQVGGDMVEIKNLVPAGAEPHDYEPTPKDIVAIYESQMFVANGGQLEPWVDGIWADLLEHSHTRSMNAANNSYPVISGDPHYWLDPLKYAHLVEAFTSIISEIRVDYPHKEYYESRSKAYLEKLNELDKKFSEGLKSCVHREFVANHAAFAYLAQRYNLTMIPIAGLSPDAEPSPKIIAELIKTVQAKNIKYILTESLVSPKIADTIAQETGAQTLVLNPLEGLTDKEIAEGQDYVSIMEQNLKNLKIALECNQQ